MRQAPTKSTTRWAPLRAVAWIGRRGRCCPTAARASFPQTFSRLLLPKVCAPERAHGCETPPGHCGYVGLRDAAAVLPAPGLDWR